jgi:hypothetical protein
MHGCWIKDSDLLALTDTIARAGLARSGITFAELQGNYAVALKWQPVLVQKPNY